MYKLIFRINVKLEKLGRYSEGVQVTHPGQIPDKSEYFFPRLLDKKIWAVFHFHKIDSVVKNMVVKMPCIFLVKQQKKPKLKSEI